jgi:erythromycin esterase-like protein/predicted phosphoribosyltransferase
MLAAKLTRYARRRDVIVLALPRGGVPVGFEVARELGVPLDAFLVRKLGVPGHEELAMGAIASGGVRVLNDDLIRSLHISRDSVELVTAFEREELERRERLYRRGRPAPVLRGQTVILVDDGLATGATMQAAIRALRQLTPARIVVAVPIGAAETCDALRGEVEEVVCDITPVPFHAVGSWYEDFSQTTDEDVQRILAGATVPSAAPGNDDPAGAAAEPALRDRVRQEAHPLVGGADDYDPLLDLVGNARFVLLGEATHGTSEFYRERAVITRRLIEEKGFTAVAVEADWPDADRVNRYVRGVSGDLDAVRALSDFQRFPTWMWRNTEVVELVRWLRAHNDRRPKEAVRVGFYGLDLYSLHASMRAVLEYLDRVDRVAADRARARYACFDHFGDDTQVYGFAAGTGLARSCQEEVVTQLVELSRRRAAVPPRGDGATDRDELFTVEQNARLVKNAEAYYRSMFLEEVSSWNLRDRHMTETLDTLAAHLSRGGLPAKIVVWAHNSHLGDARATEMGARRGELNVGQLVRERHGDDAVLVGFTTYHGTVTAASDWGAPAESTRVRPALATSHEALFHAADPTRFLLVLRGNEALRPVFHEPRLERAIGVIYRPETERQSHYFTARLGEQFDAVIHFDETRAVVPLERTATWEAGEVPETFPFSV